MAFQNFAKISIAGRHWYEAFEFGISNMLTILCNEHMASSCFLYQSATTIKLHYHGAFFPGFLPRNGIPRSTFERALDGVTIPGSIRKNGICKNEKRDSPLLSICTSKNIFLAWPRRLDSDGLDPGCFAFALQQRTILQQTSISRTVISTSGRRKISSAGLYKRQNAFIGARGRICLYPYVPGVEDLPEEELYQTVKFHTRENLWFTILICFTDSWERLWRILKNVFSLHWRYYPGDMLCVTNREAYWGPLTGIKILAS